MCSQSSYGFAILSSITTAAALLLCVMFGEVFIADVIIQSNRLKSKPEYMFEDDKDRLGAVVAALAISLVFVVAGVVSMVSFIFSVLLCNGISERQPGPVKAYLAFGVTVTALVAIVCAFNINDYGLTYKPAWYALITCGSYLSCLGMIRVTYKNILAVRAL